MDQVKLTEQEISILSDALLSKITKLAEVKRDNVSQLLKIAIDKEIDSLVKLNSKLCNCSLVKKND